MLMLLDSISEEKSKTKLIIIEIHFFFRKLHLDKASMFQDSSMAIEAYLLHLHQAVNTRMLSMHKSVIDLIDFEFEPTLMKIATFPSMHTLKLPGLKQIEIGGRDEVG